MINTNSLIFLIFIFISLQSDFDQVTNKLIAHNLESEYEASIPTEFNHFDDKLISVLDGNLSCTDEFTGSGYEIIPANEVNERKINSTVCIDDDFEHWVYCSSRAQCPNDGTNYCGVTCINKYGCQVCLICGVRPHIP